MNFLKICFKCFKDASYLPQKLSSFINQMLSGKLSVGFLSVFNSLVLVTHFNW